MNTEPNAALIVLYIFISLNVRWLSRPLFSRLPQIQSELFTARKFMCRDMDVWNKVRKRKWNSQGGNLKWMMQSRLKMFIYAVLFQTLRRREKENKIVAKKAASEHIKPVAQDVLLRKARFFCALSVRKWSNTTCVLLYSESQITIFFLFVFVEFSVCCSFISVLVSLGTLLFKARKHDSIFF